MQASHQLLYLYGGDQPWDSSLWVTTDDRVRGGSSQSYLSVLNPEKARFYGHLDTKTLGGAGFASQHSLGALDWDLSAYNEGIVIVVAKADGKRFALTVKDEISVPSDGGREQSGISWEAEFVVEGSGPENVHLPWSAFKPTYRGRPKPDAKPLDLSSIKRIGLMMRSFFGNQEGDFTIDIHAIAARGKMEDNVVKREAVDEDDGDEEDDPKSAAAAAMPEERQSQRRSWFRSLLCGLI